MAMMTGLPPTPLKSATISWKPAESTIWSPVAPALGHRATSPIALAAGTVYTLDDSFTLDDAVPDDSDGVNAGITFNVAPAPMLSPRRD